MPVVVPSEETLRGFDNPSNSLFAKIKELQKQTETLTELRDTLLPQLLSGELRIPEAEKLVEDLDKNGGQNAR